LGLVLAFAKCPSFILKNCGKKLRKKHFPTQQTSYKTIKMASIKQQQTESMLQREMSAVLRQEGAYIYGAEALVTVTQVKLTPDFGEAKFYLSVFNIEDKQSVTIHLDENLTRIRQLLATRIRKKVRRIPVISFFLDDTLDEMYRLNALFDQIQTDEDNGLNEEA
jgi:ribosome-binding factor A